MTQGAAGRADLAVRQARAALLPFGRDADLDPLLERIGGARVVLLGEPSHGTHESFAFRSTLTQRLVSELGFTAVAVEADQTDCIQIEQWLRRGVGEGPADPFAILSQLQHWPSWMLSNEEVLALCRSLGAHNLKLPARKRVRWHGLDEFPLWGGIRRVLEYVRERWPNQVNAALDAPLQGKPMVPAEHIWPAARYAAVAMPATATAYYAQLIRGGAPAMNARSLHWLDRLHALLSGRKDARVIVWAHNTHIGDARGINLPGDNSVSIGQLARLRYGADKVVLVGFAGGDGSVIAARQRGAAMDIVTVPPPARGSVEALICDATNGNPGMFIFPEDRQGGWLADERPQRAIGAVYDPRREPYVPTFLGARYDVLCWYPHITPVHALNFEAARRGQLETLRT